MTATFGCLDGETLRLEDGLNVLIRPNERGKTTWAAFLLAMFYGIDTSKRSAKGILPDKTRYQPWNGKPMSGTLELEHQGRIIVLQRTSQRGRPMGQFRAWDKQTGLEIPELTGEDCGLYFFGVEKAVFQRTAFLSGSELAVTEDQELARRLENLAVSGDMSDSYPAAEARLKQWKNRLRYHQNGLIPETEAKLRKTEQLLELSGELRRQRQDLEQALLDVTGQAEELEQQEQTRWQQALEDARRVRDQAWAAVECHFPTRPRVPESLGMPLLALRQRLREDSLPPEPPCPPELKGISADAILPKVQRDLESFTRQTGQKRKPIHLLWPVLTVILGVGLLVFRLWAAAIPVLLAAVVLGWLCFRGKTALPADDAAVLAAYGVQNRDQIMPAAVLWRDWLLAQERHHRAEWEMETQMERIREIEPGITDPDQVAEAVEYYKRFSKEERELSAVLDRAEHAWKLASVPVQPSEEIRSLRKRTAAIQLEIETLRARKEALGAVDKLRSKAQLLREELNDLYLREQALVLAREALESAHSQLEQVYAPQLTGLAGELLQKLTHDRYDALVMGKDWQMQVRERTSGLIRPLASLSAGAQDQVWLALRLSMAALLLPEDAPMVLDDALLTFDDVRTGAAMALLRQTGRQILLFSCKE